MPNQRPHTPRPYRWIPFLVFAVSSVTGFASPAHGESNAGPAKSQPTTTTQPASQPAKPTPLTTPRVTMQQFLLAVDESKEKPQRLKDAVACLDLSGLPEADRAEQGPKLAIQLERILDSQGAIALDTIPNEQEAPPYPFKIEGEGEEKTIIIARGEDGLW